MGEKKTIVFYSYKGGAGRTLALANVAMHLSEYGYRVCILDLDLEAPGIHYKFFGDGMPSIKNTKGVVDYIDYFMSNESPPPDIGQYLIKYNENITILPSGDVTSGEYWRKLARIDWHGLLYDDGAPGVRLMLDMIGRVQSDALAFDYVLIDARAGITPLSGLCVSLFGDALAVFFSPSQESMDGTRQMLRNIRRTREADGRPDIPITVALTRFEVHSRSLDEDKYTEEKKESLCGGDHGLFSHFCVIHADRDIERNEFIVYNYNKQGTVDIREELKSPIKSDYLKLFSFLFGERISSDEAKPLVEKVIQSEYGKNGGPGVDLKADIDRLGAKHKAYFAWICAMRSLPFLCVEKGFPYWRDDGGADSVQRILYEIFHALDLVAAFAVSGIAPDATAGYAAALKAIDAVTAVSEIAAATRPDGAARLAVDAVVNAATVAAAQHEDLLSYDDIDEGEAGAATLAAYAACSAAADACRVASYNIAGSQNGTMETHGIDEARFNEAIRKDIAVVGTGMMAGEMTNIAIYGKIWQYFADSLATLNCGYWADLYGRLAKKGFAIDDEEADELNLRLNVPQEIREKGAAAVTKYMAAMRFTGSVRLDEARMVILGEKGVGKTSLARRLVSQAAPMPDAGQSTAGVDVIEWVVPDSGEGADDWLNAHIWDFGGHAILHSVHRLFMSERCLYIYVYSGRIERDDRPEYWLDQIKTYGRESAPIAVVINKIDDRPVEFPINTLKMKYPSIIGCWSIDIKNDADAMAGFRTQLIGYLQKHAAWRTEEMPISLYRIKDALNLRFVNKNVDYISRSAFDGICAENGIEAESAGQALRALHVLGICLWYGGGDANGGGGGAGGDARKNGNDTVVLNPGWIAKGVYGLVNWGFNNNKWEISVEDAEGVFKNDITRFPRDQIQFLFGLMNRYELAYPIGTGQIIVPILLPADQPQNLPAIMGDRLYMEYRADNPLPPNTVARFIVRRHEDIQSGSEVWRHGAVLRHGGATALVREEDRSIRISVTGDGRTEYVTLLRDTFDGIFDSCRMERPQLFYEVIMPDGDTGMEGKASISGVAGQEPVMLPDSAIRSYIESGMDYFEPKSRKSIPLAKTGIAYGAMGNVNERV